jgi:hypothetical protein
MQALPDATAWSRDVEIGRGVQATFEFEKTTKGNGVLRFPGGCARVYDSHDDSVTFEPFALDIRLVEIDDDGYLDVVATGIGVHREEKTDREIERRPVRSTFRFDPRTKTFRPFERDSWVELDGS